MQACRQLTATASTTSLLNGARSDNFDDSVLALFAADIKRDLLMPGITNLSNTVALVRFFELSV